MTTYKIIDDMGQDDIKKLKKSIPLKFRIMFQVFKVFMITFLLGIVILIFGGSIAVIKYLFF